MGDLSKRTDSWCSFSWSILNKMATLLGVSRAAVSKVLTAYTNHGRTSSGKRNSGWKSKLGDRNHSILKRIVSKNHRITAAKVRAELIIHLEDPVSIRTRSRFHPPSSLNQLGDVLHEEWYYIPLETIQNIYESIPRRIQAELQANGGPTLY